MWNYIQDFRQKCEIIPINRFVQQKSVLLFYSFFLMQAYFQKEWSQHIYAMGGGCLNRNVRDPVRNVEISTQMLVIMTEMVAISTKMLEILTKIVVILIEMTKIVVILIEMTKIFVILIEMIAILTKML